MKFVTQLPRKEVLKGDEAVEEQDLFKLIVPSPETYEIDCFDVWQQTIRYQLQRMRK